MPRAATSKSRPRKSGELDAGEEQAIGHAILACERSIRDTLRGIAVADRILSGARRRPGRTRAGEVDQLGRAVEAVRRAARSEPPLRGPAREAGLAWARSQSLRWQLAISGRRIAYGEARKLGGRHLGIDDLCQEGFIGLLRAAKRFDPSRGLRFSTYARWWVRAQMTRAIDEGGRTIRLPGNAVEQQRNLKRAIQARERDGSRWSLEEVAEEIGLGEDRARVLMQSHRFLSLHAPLDDDEGRMLAEVIPDEERDPADVELAREREVRRVQRVLGELDDRSRYVLARRFELDGRGHATLAQLGRELGVSRERARQIEKRALLRLRAHLESEATPVAA